MGPDRKWTDIVPRQSVVYLAMCLSGVLIFLLAGILPNQRSIKESAAAVEQTRRLIAEQKEWKPVHDMLRRKLREGADAPPLPPKEKLARGKTETIQGVLRGMAETAGVSTVSVTPDTSAVADNPERILVTVLFRGEFFAIRRLLMDIGAIPYLEKIGELQIRQTPKDMEIKMKLWIALG